MCKRRRLLELIFLHKGECQYCGVRITKARRDPPHRDTDATIEHKIPRSHGGSNRAENLTLACLACNQEKSNMTPVVLLVMRWIAWSWEIKSGDFLPGDEIFHRRN